MLALVAAIALLVDSVQPHYPIQRWLFWRYAGYWTLLTFWGAACLSAGFASLRLLLPRLPLLEQLAIGFALGVFEFELLMFLAGLARLYGPVLFIALPALLLASGARPLWRALRRLRRHAGRLRPRPSAWVWPVLGFGLLYLIALYLPVLVPENVSYDARWRHMMAAEQYAVYGGLRRFPEGWVFAATPVFTPLLYTWGFLLPWGVLFDRVELCAHLEYVVFLWTTFTGIPIVVRRLVPRADPAIVWVARCLFPGALLYDSNLSGGTDHIGAVFAAPMFVLSLRAWRGMDTRTCALLGLFIAAAVCAKETTALLLAPAPILLVAVRFAVDAVGAARRREGALRRMVGALAAGAAALVFSAPHWLKNIVWYGDPLYPNLHAYFRGRPWDADMAYVFEQAFMGLLWTPPKDISSLWTALTTLATFSFVPHGWWGMHRNVPVFGSLFTLLLLVLPFLRGTRRIWLLVAFVHLAIFAWFWLHHEERHLQALVPWMAAAVAAALILIWRTRSTALRACACALVGLQAIWGADVYFIPTHAMLDAAPIKAVADLLAKGFEGKHRERLDVFAEQRAIGAAVPKKAVLLVNERRDHLGLGRTAITDFYADQYGINYARLTTPDRVYARLRELGVTHIAWRAQTRGYQPLAGDIVFFEFAARYTLKQRVVNGTTVAEMPSRAPARPTGPRRVAVIGCGGDYESGVYDLADLRVPRFGPRRTLFPRPREALGSEATLPDRVFAIAADADCKERVGGKARRRFERVGKRSNEWGRAHEIWVRRP